MSIKVLFFGGSGQIGSEFTKLLKDKYKIFSPTHKQLDITNKSKVENYIERIKPDQIIYSIGFTSIDLAPRQPYHALQLNVLGLYNTTGIASKKNIPVHFLSTEVVFNGHQKSRPYKEDDHPDPQSLNARLKRIGEMATLDSSPKNSVIRLIICYSSFYERKSDIVRLLIKKLKQGKSFSATIDQEINPIYVSHLIRAISIIIDNKAHGIYHIGAKDYTTPYDFCKKIAKKLGLNPNLIKGVTFKQFSKTRSEPRPQHEWLDVSKFLKDFGPDSLYTIDEGIEDFVADYQKLTLN